MSALPVTLRPLLWGRIFVLAVAFGYPALVWLAVQHGAVDAASPMVVAYLGWVTLAGLVALVALLRKLLGQRVILHDDGMELLGPGAGRARMRWSELAGYRISGVSLVLVPRDAEKRPLEIEFHFDRERLKRHLPHGLDDLGLQQVEGIEPRGLIFALDAAMFFLAYLFRDLLAALGTAALLPLTILLAVSAKGGRRIGLVPGERKAPVLVALSGPLVAAAALQEASPIGGLVFWGTAIVGGVLLALLVRAVQPDAWTPLFAGAFLPGLGAWAVGLLLVVNGLADAGPAERYRPAIVERAEARLGGRVRILVLAPWGPFREPLRLRVDRDLHEAAVTGGTALVTLHRGALGIPWYRVESVSGP